MSEPKGTGERARVFISYSRTDLAFADQLEATLHVAGFEADLDRHSIEGGEDWRQRIGELILAADTVIIVLTAASLLSPVCQWELDEAWKLTKRVLPVLPTPIAGAMVPSRLAALNYIYCYSDERRPGSGIGNGIKELVQALRTDLGWLREHSRLLQRAKEWELAGRPDNKLLFGTSIADAQAWASRRPRSAPEITQHHADFIRASEIAETERQNLERQRLEEIATVQSARARALEEKEAAQQREAEQARRVVRRTLLGASLAIVLGLIAGAAGIYGHIAGLDADTQRKIAEEESRQAMTLVTEAAQMIGSGRSQDAEFLIGYFQSNKSRFRGQYTQLLANAGIARGRQHLAEGHPESARLLLQMALRHSPTADIYNRYARSWLIWERAEEGLASAETAVSMAPNEESYLNTRGQIYLALGRIDDALKDLDRAIDQGVHDASTYLSRGRCRESKGDRTGAISDYRAALARPAEEAGDTSAEGLINRVAQTKARARLVELGEHVN